MEGGALVHREHPGGGGRREGGRSWSGSRRDGLVMMGRTLVHGDHPGGIRWWWEELWSIRSIQGEIGRSWLGSGRDEVVLVGGAGP